MANMRCGDARALDMAPYVAALGVVSANLENATRAQEMAGTAMSSDQASRVIPEEHVASLEAFNRMDLDAL